MKGHCIRDVDKNLAFKAIEFNPQVKAGGLLAHVSTTAAKICEENANKVFNMD